MDSVERGVDFSGAAVSYRQLALAGIDLQPFHADGAGGHARFLRFARPEQGRRDIGAGAPVGADRDLDHRTVRRKRSRRSW